MNEEYDFYLMGCRNACEYVENIDKKAKEIEEKYGLDARIQYEAGIIATIPTYSKCKTKINIEKIHGTLNFANNENTSYFDDEGFNRENISKK